MDFGIHGFERFPDENNAHFTFLRSKAIGNTLIPLLLSFMEVREEYRKCPGFSNHPWLYLDMLSNALLLNSAMQSLFFRAVEKVYYLRPI